MFCGYIICMCILIKLFIPVPAMSIAVPLDALRADNKTVRSGPRQNRKWETEGLKKKWRPFGLL